MFIASNGAIARTTTTSSREAKENIRPLTFNTDDFISVSPVLFDYKEGIITEGNGNDIIGFIAEDFQDLGFDELITPKESESDYIGLRYDKLYMYLHKVVAMQNERIKLLEGK
jgi:biotin synthase-related radical SAM superfamily protein